MESAKEAKSSKVKAECLRRAVAKLTPLDPIELPKPEGGGGGDGKNTKGDPKSR